MKFLEKIIEDVLKEELNLEEARPERRRRELRPTEELPAVSSQPERHHTGDMRRVKDAKEEILLRLKDKGITYDNYDEEMIIRLIEDYTFPTIDKVYDSSAIKYFKEYKKKYNQG